MYREAESHGVLVVEPVRTNDLTPVARLAYDSLREHFSPEWLAMHASGNDTFLVARDIGEGQIVGFALAEQKDCEAHLLAIAVKGNRRGEGIGQTLLGHVKQEMACAGARRLQLEVRAEDRMAQRFYRRNGFHPEGLQTEVYSDGGDAIVMAKPL